MKFVARQRFQAPDPKDASKIVTILPGDTIDTFLTWPDMSRHALINHGWVVMQADDAESRGASPPRVRR